jgi:transcriptional repressor NrdR
MRCPACSSFDDRVVDTRLAEEGSAIRRRRECIRCGRRFTTYERFEDLPLVVIKRSGQTQPFDRGKIVAGVRAAAKNRPVASKQMEALAMDVEESLRLEGRDVTTQLVGRAVLERLRELDEVAYVRFASVYKGFSDAGDFEREIGLLTKSTDPKHQS